MRTTTTDGIEGKKTKEYLGIVSGEVIMGTNIFRDLFAAVRDVVGGRSAAYEKELKAAKEMALEDMKAEATALGADAVIGVSLDHEVVGGGKKTLLMVCAVGTAVTCS